MILCGLTRGEHGMRANGHDNTRCRRGPPAPYCLIPSRSPGLSSTFALLALRRCKGKGVRARGCLKAAWNEGAGRGARTGDEVWYRRDERAHDREVLPPHMGGAFYIRRLCTDGMTAYDGRPLLCPGKWRATK